MITDIDLPSAAPRGRVRRTTLLRRKVFDIFVMISRFGAQEQAMGSFDFALLGEGGSRNLGGGAVGI
jgi:hypothetical protein